jgi:hypothetical protein
MERYKSANRKTPKKWDGSFPCPMISLFENKFVEYGDE